VVELKKNLGFWTVFSITITAMIGTGMFFGTSLAASKAGTASLLVWMILGLITIYVGACFGELTSMFPSAGGIYEFSKQAYGRGIFSFLVGWTSWVVINMMNSLLIVAALDYIMPINVNVIIKIAVSIMIIVMLNYFAFLGTDTISAILNVFAFIILTLMLTIIFVGTPHIDPANYSPIFSAAPVMLLVAFFFIVETFFGWENATFMAEETVDAEKTIPKALLAASIFVSVLGMAFAAVLLGILSAPQLAQSITPVADVSSILFNPSLSIIISIGVALALIGSATGGLIGSPRLLLGLARDKMFIEQLSEIHPKYQTPHKAILFQTIVSIIVVLFGFGNYSNLLSLMVPIALLMYTSVLIAVVVLRFKKPDHPRPFKVWFGKIGPIIVSLIYLSVIVSWILYTYNAINMLRLGISFILFGIPIFLLLISYYDPEYIRTVNDSFARLSVWFEGVNFPKKFRMELLEYFKDLQDKTVLDYGAGVGTLTLHLSETVGPNGKIYATDLSEKNIEILNKRLSRRNIANVEVIHDEHQFNRVHPSIRNVDAVFSLGMLSYVQDVKKVLKEIHKILPNGGKVCMVEYVDFFWVLPNVKWLSDNHIVEQIFKESGFSVHVKRMKRMFWSYVVVYGIKSEEDVPFI
jgi:basic amino acid/polyamine antiporter, APA family